MIRTCNGCAATKTGPTGDPTDFSPSLHCDKCPPWRCEDCGEMDSFAVPCRCWVSVDSLPLADLKGIFAASDLCLTIAGPKEQP